MTFADAAHVHIASRGASGTRTLYRADLRRWLAFCNEWGWDPEAPTLENAVVFRDSLLASLADQTVRRILSALSSMYDASGCPNPFKSSKRLPRPSADSVILTKEFSPAEAKALLRAAAGSLRDYAVVRILYDTGMRINSILSLRRDQMFDRSDGRRVVVTKVKRKGRVEIALPIDSVVALSRWLAVAPASPYLFPADRVTGPLPRRTFSRNLARYGERVGVAGAAPHRFRATYITEALDAGVPLNEVQASVHHSVPQTTQRYDRGARGEGVASRVAEFRKGR